MPAIPRPRKPLEPPRTVQPVELKLSSQQSGSNSKNKSFRQLRYSSQRKKSIRKRGVSQLSRIDRSADRDSEPFEAAIRLSKGKTSSERKSRSPQAEPREQVLVPTMPAARKELLFRWLVEQGLVRGQQQLKAVLPQACKDGRLFLDLVNRISGRRHPLAPPKMSNPPKRPEIIALYARIFDYLSSFQKMNPRFLGKSVQFAEGQHPLFWALLDDLYYFKLYKISPNDPRYVPAQTKGKQNRLPEQSRHNTEIVRYEDLRPLTKRSTKLTGGDTQTQPSRMSNRLKTNESEPNRQLLTPERLNRVIQLLKKLGLFYAFENARKKQGRTEEEDAFGSGYFLAQVFNRMEILGMDGIRKPPCSKKQVQQNISLLNCQLSRRFKAAPVLKSILNSENSLTFLLDVLQCRLHEIRRESPGRKSPERDTTPLSQLKLFLRTVQLPQPPGPDFERELPQLLRLIGFEGGLKPTTPKLIQRNTKACLTWLRESGLSPAAGWQLVDQVYRAYCRK